MPLYIFIILGIMLCLFKRKAKVHMDFSKSRPSIDAKWHVRSICYQDGTLKEFLIGQNAIDNFFISLSFGIFQIGFQDFSQFF